jgi:DNA-binding CsgD family transcriptional regulator
MELRCIQGVADGLTNKQIARRHRVKPTTVRSQLWTAYNKLGVRDRALAVMACTKAGWIGLEDPHSGIRQVRRLADATEQLVEGIRRKRRLTPSQRAYLEAFDEMVDATGDQEKTAARRQMQAALKHVLADAGLPDVPRERQRSLLDLLAPHVPSDGDGWP